MEVRKTHPSQEAKAQRAAKQAKIGQKGAKRRNEPQVAPPAWLPALMLDETPLLASASIKDFQGGKASYVANAMEQALLLPEDMAELHSMRRHEVFLSLKRYLTMVCSLLDPFFFFLSFFFFFFFNLCFLPRQLSKPPSKWKR